MEPGRYKRVRFGNEFSAVTTTEVRKVTTITSSVTSSVTAGSNSAPCAGSFKFKWIVENFSCLTEETTIIGPSGSLDLNSAVKSSVFVTEDVATHHWALLLHPAVVQYATGSQLQNPRYNRSSCVGVHLQLQRPSEDIRHVVFTISLCNTRGERVHCLEKSVAVCNGYLGESESRYQAVMSDSLGGCSGWPNFISRQALMRASDTLLADNDLTIRCDMLIYYQSAILSDGASNPSSLKNRITSRGDLLDMYRCQKGFDVILRCGKTEIGAHKRVLAARSTAFKVLFESQPNDDYDMFGVNDLAMRLVLNFIYGTDIEKYLTPENCQDVYIAANKFRLPDLSRRCMKIMIDNMRVRNVCNIACLAYADDNQEMFASVKRFVRANASTVLVSPEWVKFVQRRPELAIQLV